MRTTKEFAMLVENKKKNTLSKSWHLCFDSNYRVLYYYKLGMPKKEENNEK
jgi:hypothetical protein